MASIRERRRKSDGSTYFSVLYRVDGRQTSISADDLETAKYLQAHLNLTGVLPQSFAPPAASFTVEEMVTAHIDGLSGVQEFTRQKYRSMARIHIAPVIGAMPASSVTRDVVARWCDGINRAPKTVREVHALLSAAFSSAALRGETLGNPAKGVRLPQVAPDESPLLERETFVLINACVADRWQPFIRLLALSGMRWGEAAALLPVDVDMKRATIRVNKAVKRVDGAANVIGPPKTPRARRTINVPAEVMLDLAPRMSAAGRLFADLVGEGLRSDSTADAWGRGVSRAAKAHPGEVTWRPTLRDLRRAHASWLLEAGASPNLVQRRLGHEKIATTMEIYARVSRDADAAAVALLDGVR